MTRGDQVVSLAPLASYNHDLSLLTIHPETTEGYETKSRNGIV